MLKVITGMIVATVLLTIGFYAGTLCRGRQTDMPVQVVQNDYTKNFNKMLEETAARISLPVKIKGGK